MINWLEKILLRRIINTRCPDGLLGSDIKCYVIRLKNGPDEYLLYVQEIHSKGFSGTHWNDQDRQNYPASVPFSLMRNVSVRIERIIGSWKFIYPSVLKCILYDWTYLNRLPIIRDAVDQFFFNQKRDVAIKESTKMLKALIVKYREEPNVVFYEYKFMEIIHGQRWKRHPDCDDLDQLITHGRIIPHNTRIILDSLEESGEIQKVRKGNFDAYELTGKALITLETYEREAIRHEQMLSKSRHMKWLTFALIIVGIIQALVAFFHK
jgi:hypothetical protein